MSSILVAAGKVIAKAEYKGFTITVTKVSCGSGTVFLSHSSLRYPSPKRYAHATAEKAVAEEKRMIDDVETFADLVREMEERADEDEDERFEILNFGTATGRVCF